MKRAQRMRKARMLRRLIGKMRQTELANAPQTLKFGGVDQPDKQPSCLRIGLETNDVVNRIAVNFLRQIFLLRLLKLNFPPRGKFSQARRKKLP
jgi:hypothetical protein